MSEPVNDLLSIVGDDLSLRWMITLLHFLWQGTFIGVSAAILAKVLQNASSSLRYAVYSVALFCFPACVLGTFALVDVPDALRKPSLAVVKVDVPSVPNPEQNALHVAEQPLANSSSTSSPLLAETTTENLEALEPNPVIREHAIAWRPFPWVDLVWLAPWISAAYLCGVVLCLMRLGRALWGGHRLRSVSLPLSNSAVIQSMREQAKRIGLRVVPVVGYCERVAVPTVIGVLRPMILLPTSIMTGLTSQELSALLSHELAHIRRYDLWMNLIQRFIESLLFFHPAVWFISRLLSAEREICCDDLVVQSGHTQMNYAGALLRMAELCVANKAQLTTLAAAGHSTAELERRIERLMNIRHQATLRLTRGGVLLLIGSLLTCVATPAVLVALTQSTIREQAKSAEVSQSVPTDFDLATGRNVLWRVPLGSVTMRAPLAHGDHIYVGTNNEHAYNSRYPTSVDLGVLLCFQKSDGKFLWQHSNEKLPSGRAHDWPMQGVTSRPCVEGDRLWYITNRCELVCLDTQGFHDSENDGFVKDEQPAEAIEADVVWRYDMMDKLGVRPHNVSTCTVAVWKDRVFAVTGNGVDESHQAGVADAPSFIAVDKQTGKLLWSDDSPGQNIMHGQWGSPVVAELAGKTQVIFPGGDGWLYSFDPLGNGAGKSKLIWKFDCNPKESVWILGGGFMGGGRSARNNLLHAPTVNQGLLYIAMGEDPEHGGGPGRVWCIDPSGTGDVSPELVFNKSDPGKPIPHRRAQACIAANGDFTRPNPNSKAVWQFTGQDVDGNGKLSIEETMSRSLSTISIKDDLLFVSDIEGILHCLDRRTGLQHWSYDLQASIYSTPMIAGQRVTLGDEDGNLSVFGCSSDPKVAFPNGEPLRQMNFNNSINSSTIMDGNVMFVATRNELVAIGETTTVEPHASALPKQNASQPVQENPILGQWDVLPTPGNTTVVPIAESMTLVFSEPDKFERYVQKQDYVEFSTGSWKLEGDKVSVKFKSFVMQPTDQAKGEATLEIAAPDTLLLDGTRFRKRSSATPVTLAKNHPLHDVAKELLAKLNESTPAETWQIVQLSDKPTVIAPQVVDKLDASKANGYRLLLARDYRESGNMMQQAAMLPTDQPFRWRTEEFEIVLFADQLSKASTELRSRIAWLPSKSRWPTHELCLGDGLGYTWFVRAPMQIGYSLKYGLQFAGGDDMLNALVQSAISTKNMPPAADSQIASALLSAQGERAVAAVEQAVRRKKPQEDLSRLIGCLAGIRTDSSTKLLIQLYQSDDADIRRAAAYSLIYKPYREEASQVYLHLLKNRMSVEDASAACIELGLKDAIPILKELFLNTTKPSSLRELKTIYAARRMLEGNPIPKSLLEASEVIYQSRPSDPMDEGSVIGNAVTHLMESKDHEAVIMLALQMVNYATKGSFEHIRAIHAHGTAILKSQKSAEAVFFATRVLDSLDQREREQILQTMNPLVQSNSAVTPNPQPSPYQPGPDTTLPEAKPLPTGPRKLVATIFGTTVYLDQLEPVESSKAELSKLPQDQAAAKRLEMEGEKLLKMIARRAVEDYVRREQIEITPEMSSKLFEVVKSKDLPANPDSTMSDDKRRAGLLFMMRASLLDWLVCKSLYEKYGGRVGMGSLGLWIAVDGRNELMREYLKKGSIVISDAELETAFWNAANKPNFADAYPKGEELKRLMSTPPFFGDGQ